MNDTLKSGAVDAVLTAEPFVTRMTKAGTGYVAAQLRRRTRAHRADHLLCRFARLRREESRRRSTISAPRSPRRAEIVNNDREKASVSIANFTKQPLEIVRAEPAQSRRARLEGRATGLVARRDEAAGPAADRDQPFETRAAMIVDAQRFADRQAGRRHAERTRGGAGRGRYRVGRAGARLAARHRRSRGPLRHRRDAGARRPFAADRARPDRRDRPARLSRQRDLARRSRRHHAAARADRMRGACARAWRAATAPGKALSSPPCIACAATPNRTARACARAVRNSMRCTRGSIPR